jgi:hypothetical protein
VSDGLKYAHQYHALGWHPIPLPYMRKKEPPNGLTGHGGRDLSLAQINAMDWSGNIALRMPPTVIGLDVDAYKSVVPFDQMIAELGPLPPTIRSHNGRTDGSCIRYFKVPAGSKFVQAFSCGEVIQHHHRYAIVAPSIHPEGRSYGWWDEADEMAVEFPPDVGDLPDLPWPWWSALASDAEGKVASSATLAEVAKFVAEHTSATKPQLLKGVVRKLDEARQLGRGRHPSLVEHACWAMREAAAGLYPADDAVDALATSWRRVMDDPKRAATSLDAGWRNRPANEFASVICWAIGQAVADPERIQQIADEHSGPRPRGDASADVDPETGEIAGARLPPEFWSYRPELGHIRIAANADLVSAEALLLAVLARVIASIPQAITLPRPPRPGSLNSYVAIVGPPGSAKGSVMDAASQLIASPFDAITTPLGTPQGFVREFYEPNTDTDAEARRRFPMVRHHHPVIVRSDEIGAYAEATANRSGGNAGDGLLAQLKQAWSGERLGHGYATTEKRLRPAEHSYRVVAVLGVAPAKAAPLFHDLGGGLPERVLFAPSLCHGLPPIDQIPEHPGAWTWEVPTPPPHNNRIPVAPEIAREILNHRHGRSSGTITVDALDVHLHLNQLKVATALAVLNRRWNVRVDDWNLAADVITMHRATRRALLATINYEKDKGYQEADDRAARRAVRTADAMEARERRRIVEGAIKLAHRVHEGEPMTRGDHRRAMKHYREQFDDIADHAIAEGWIAEVSERGQGEDKRTLRPGSKRPPAS